MRKKLITSVEIGDVIIFKGNVITVLDVQKTERKVFLSYLDDNGEAQETWGYSRDVMMVFSSVDEADAYYRLEFNSEEILPFFVYGTLRRGMGNHDHYLDGKTVKELPAKTEGLLFHAGSIVPYMTRGDGIVVGELMYTQEDFFYDVLRDLDNLEGYVKGSDYNHYVRERVMATLEDGSQVEAYAYFYGGSSDRLVPIPHGDYKRWRMSGRV